MCAVCSTPLIERPNALSVGKLRNAPEARDSGNGERPMSAILTETAGWRAPVGKKIRVQ